MDTMPDLARRAALRLGAEMDPGLPGRVERVLTADEQGGLQRALEGHDLASFLVATAAIACRVYQELRRKTETPAAVYLERRLQSEMGIDAGTAPDREVIIEALVAEVMAGQPG